MTKGEKRSVWLTQQYVDSRTENMNWQEKRWTRRKLQAKNVKTVKIGMEMRG